MRVAAVLAACLAVGLFAYGIGRVQAKVGYRLGYRFGYRQGYFDGDRAGWNRRRREAQAAVESALGHWYRGATHTMPVQQVPQQAGSAAIEDAGMSGPAGGLPIPSKRDHSPQ